MSLEQQIFFELVKVGLFPVHGEGGMVTGSFPKDVDWNVVYRLAEEQSVIGLIASGIEAVQGEWLKVHGSSLLPQEWALQFIGQTLQIEQRNKAMNEFVARLIEKLRENDIYALLVKGQGVAQCYERPLWRASGDIDWLLDEPNYNRAKAFLTKIAEVVHEENDFDKHFSVIMDGWDVELHGSMRSMLPKGTDYMIDQIQREAFQEGRHRVWNNNGTDILLPCPDDDIIFVFTHILKHFFHYGIGIRQVCDWCRLVYSYHEQIDLKLLEDRLVSMRLMTEWKVFGSMAVNNLGMPADAMPFYSSKDVWKRKGDRALAFIMETGNFGHNRDNSRYSKVNAIISKLGSLWQHTCDSFRHSFIFPIDSVRIWGRMFRQGIGDALRGK